MTALISMIDKWSEALENGENQVILVLDQSAAYDIICHQKLIEKLKILGATNSTTEFFKDYLRNRLQTVTVEAFQSNTLDTGPLSVCQGSTLSGSLCLVYTLDYPLLHHKYQLNMKQYDKSNENKTTTFVDDSSIQIKIGTDTIENNALIKNSLDKIKMYMDSNSLVLNKDKSKLIVITNQPEIRNKISIVIEGKEEPITPSRNLKFLRIQVTDDLKWNYYISEGKDNLAKILKQKLNAVKLVRKYISESTTKMLINGVFYSTLMYGACLWVGAPKYIKNIIQKIQLEACRTVFGFKSVRWSTSKLLTSMKWLSVQKILQKENAIMTHKILNTDNPEYIAFKMKTKYQVNTNINQINTRRTGNGKLGIRPKQVGKTKTTKYHYRASAYDIFANIPDEILNIKNGSIDTMLTQKTSHPPTNYNPDNYPIITS